MKKHYFALSDIHGRSVSIEDFESKGFDLENPDHIIVLLGDYFDRGPDNLGVLSFIEASKTLLKERFIVIKGNHDEFIIKFLKHTFENSNDDQELKLDEKLMDHWFRNGGAITLQQLFGNLEGPLDKEKMSKLERLLNFTHLLEDYYETKDYIFTHASINHDRSVDTWNRDFLHEGLNVNKDIIVGHTSHPYLDDRMEIKNFGSGLIAQSRTSNVIDIDNGQGNNIVLFIEK